MPDNEANQVREAFSKIEQALDSFNRKLKTSIGPDGVFTLAERTLGGMAKSMLGPVGVAAGFIGVAKALESVAASSVQLQYFARDTGYAVKSVSDMQGAMRMMGAGVQEANSSIANLGNKMQSLAVFKEGSEIWQGMAKFPGKGAEIANTLMRIAQEGMRSGDQMGATAKMLELFNKQAPETKFAWAQVWGESVSHLENMARKLEIVRKLGIPQWDKGEEERYLEMMVGWELRVEYVWKRVAKHGMEAANLIGDSFSAQGVTMEGVVGYINDQTDKSLATLKATIEEFRSIKQFFDDLKNNPEAAAKTAAGVVSQPFGPSADWMNKTPEQFLRDRQLSLRPKIVYPMADDPMGADYTARSKPGVYDRFKNWWFKNSGSDAGIHAGVTDFSGMRRTETVQEESSKTLIDIRDILQRMETGDSGGGSSTGGAQGHGIPGLPGGPVSPFKFGDPGGPGTLGDRLNNPGNLKYGPFAKSMGATGAGPGGQAVFPDYQTGRKAMEGLLTSKGAGQSIAELNSWYAEDPNWKNNVAKAMGVSPDYRPTPEDLPRLADAIQRAEGTRVGGMAGGGSGPGASLARVNPELIAMVKAGAKYLPEGYTIRPTSGFRNSAGYHGVGQASDWQIYTPDGKPIPNRGPDTTGLYTRLARGAYTEMLENNPQYKGKFAWGGAFETSSGSGQQDLMHFDLGGERGRLSPQLQLQNLGPLSPADVAAARSRVDQAQSGGGDKWNGGINAKVEFLNVPGGVKTSAETDGDVFKQLQISRTRQAGVFRQPSGYE